VRAAIDQRRSAALGPKEHHGYSGDDAGERSPPELVREARHVIVASELRYGDVWFGVGGSEHREHGYRRIHSAIRDLPHRGVALIVYIVPKPSKEALWRRKP
jgi:hypothetical protein